MEYTTYSKLTLDEKVLIDAAEEAIELSYYPYGSKRKVGAAARSFSGKIIKGGNFGNSFNIVDICAERSVIITASNLGVRDIKEIAVISSCDSKSDDKPLMPCGVCRQTLLEVTKIIDKDLIIYCCNQNKRNIIKTSLYELLPSYHE
jgi:cytidine deaminase